MLLHTSALALGLAHTHDSRTDDGEHGEEQENHTNRLCEERGDIAHCHHHSASQVGLDHAAENKTEDERCSRDLNFVESIAHKAEEEYSDDIERTVVDTESSDGAECHDAAQEYVFRHLKHSYKKPHADKLKYEHHYVGDEGGDKN